MLDVVSEIEIARPRAQAAAYALDPDHAPQWQKTVASVQWETQPPIAVGARFAFVRKVAGTRIAYDYEVLELIPDELLVMRTSDGPFAVETTYAWADAPDGGTLMTLRNHGEPKSKLATPLIVRGMRRANRNDLRGLKRILEAGEPRG